MMSTVTPTYKRNSYLLGGFCVEQYPTQLNDLGGILGDKNAMFIAGSGYVYDDVAIQVGL